MSRHRSRRAFLRGSFAAGAVAAGSRVGFPAVITRDASRPAVAEGAAVGDVAAGRATVWSRTDRPARMVVEYATRESFADARRIVGPAALEEDGFTAQVELTGVPAGQRIVYRVLFQDLGDLRTWSPAASGSFLSGPAEARDLTFAWSADTAGQGWGINPSWGGMRLYGVMRRAAPDFFVHCGDTCYADVPLLPEVRLEDGSVWKNLVTPAKSKVAETLDEFRGNHLYSLLDENVRRFNAEVPLVALWDDHEVVNNWFPEELLDDPRYRVKSVALLAARSRRAFFEHYPIRRHGDERERSYRSLPYGPSLELFALDLRSYRGPNSPNRQEQRGPATALLGPEQLAWLADGLARSPATWKVVASDMPLGLLVPDGPTDFEAVANGDGPPRGRELEIAWLLAALRERGVRNVVWITGDVHYAAAHHYDPARARFKAFRPFWEFVAGPLHAGTFGPAVLDDTFGPEVRFVGIPAGMKPNRPPTEGLQFFGTVHIAASTGIMTVRLHDLSGRAVYAVDLAPER